MLFFIGSNPFPNFVKKEKARMSVITSKKGLKDRFGVSYTTLKKWCLPLINAEIINYKGLLRPVDVCLILWFLEGQELPNSLKTNEKIYIEKIKNCV